MQNSSHKLQIWFDDSGQYIQYPKRVVNEVGCVEQGGTNELENGEDAKDKSIFQVNHGSLSGTLIAICKCTAVRRLGLGKTLVVRPITPFT